MYLTNNDIGEVDCPECGKKLTYDIKEDVFVDCTNCDKEFEIDEIS